MAKSSVFRKLSGRSLLSVQKAYLAEDHLLVVNGQYKETYKRLYYNDIEAIMICPTKGGTVMAILLAVVSLLMILPSFFGGFDFVPLAVFGAIPAVFAAVLFYGKGSAVFGVKTAVQLVLLDGVTSRRKARKAEQRLSAEVERVQGALTEQALQAALYKDGASHRYGVRAPVAESVVEPSHSPQASTVATETISEIDASRFGPK